MTPADRIAALASREAQRAATEARMCAWWRSGYEEGFAAAATKMLAAVVKVCGTGDAEEVLAAAEEAPR